MPEFPKWSDIVSDPGWEKESPETKTQIFHGYMEKVVTKHPVWQTLKPEQKTELVGDILQQGKIVENEKFKQTTKEWLAETGMGTYETVRGFAQGGVSMAAGWGARLVGERVKAALPGAKEVPTGKEMQQKVQEATSFSPESEPAKRIEAAAAPVLEAVSAPSKAVADKVTEKFGPQLGGLVEVGGEALTFWSLGKIGSAVKAKYGEKWNARVEKELANQEAAIKKATESIPDPVEKIEKTNSLVEEIGKSEDPIKTTQQFIDEQMGIGKKVAPAEDTRLAKKLQKEDAVERRKERQKSIEEAFKLGDEEAAEKLNQVFDDFEKSVESKIAESEKVAETFKPEAEVPAKRGYTEPAKVIGAPEKPNAGLNEFVEKQKVALATEDRGIPPPGRLGVAKMP